MGDSSYLDHWLIELTIYLGQIRNIFRSYMNLGNWASRLIRPDVSRLTGNYRDYFFIVQSNVIGGNTTKFNFYRVSAHCFFLSYIFLSISDKFKKYEIIH